MSFSPERLLNALLAYSIPTGYLLGFSGGMDSHVLLHALVAVREQLPAPLRAIHIDHGLQSPSREWAAHCRAVCNTLQVPLQVISLKLRPLKGESLEAVARQARYAEMASLIRPGEMLLTAHHQDDQAETLLLQLLRGAGLSGLAAMPELTNFATGQHVRPLLDTTRDELMRYATEAGLQWVEDGSNQELSFDRNYLRHQIIPLLAARWPALAKTVSRSARHCAAADQLLMELLAKNLAPMRDPVDGSLSVGALLAQPANQIGPLLRTWIKQAVMPLPDTVTLSRIIDEVLPAGLDRQPLVRWSGAEVRRYRDQLYLMAPLPLFDPGQSLIWNGQGCLKLPSELGTLRFRPRHDAEAPMCPEPARYRIRFRQAGEWCRPVGRGGKKRVKQLLQEGGVFPWMRDRVPLLEVDGEIAELVGLCHCEPGCQDRLLQQTEITWDSPRPWRPSSNLHKSD